MPTIEPILYSNLSLASSIYGQEFTFKQQLCTSDSPPEHVLRCGQLARYLGLSLEAQRYIKRSTDLFFEQQNLYGWIQATIEHSRLEALLGHYQTSVSLLCSAHRHMHRLSEKVSVRAQIAFSMGRCMRELGYVARSIICFEYAMRFAEQAKDYNLYIMAYTEHWDNHPKASIEEMQIRRNKAQELIDTISGLSAEAHILVGYRWSRNEPNYLDRRIDAYNHAIRLGSVELIARTSNTLSNAYKYRAKNEMAINFGEQAIQLSHYHNYARLESLFSSELSLVYRRMGKYQRAKALLLRAISLREQIIWRSFQQTILASAYGNLGSIHKQSDELDFALTCFMRSFMLHKQKGSLKGQRTQAGNIGTVYHKRGEIKQAESWYKEARTIDERLESPTAQSRQAGNLASLYLQGANASVGQAREQYLQQALEQVDLALANLSPASQVRRSVFNLGRKGTILLTMGDATNALPLLVHSYRMCRRYRRVNEAVIRLTKISQAYQMLNHPDLSHKASLLAVRISMIEGFEWSRYRAIAHKTLAQSLAVLGRYHEALEQYQLAARIVSQSYDLIQSEETGINLASRTSNLYEDAIRFCFQFNMYTEAFYFIEVFRQPIFRQRLSLMTIYPPQQISEEVITEETDLLQRLLEIIYLIGDMVENQDKQNDVYTKETSINKEKIRDTLPQLQNEMSNIRERLAVLWNMMDETDEGVEYVAMRNGDSATFFNIIMLLKNKK